MRGNDERQEEIFSYLRWKEDSGDTPLADDTQHGMRGAGDRRFPPVQFLLARCC
jgi:hypothetical protein